MQKLLSVILLPPQISAFERQYLARVNRLTMQFFLLHVPVFVLVAWFNETGPLLALALTGAVVAGPVLAYRLVENPRTVGLVYGFTAMLMGGLLVHFGQGPVQIEMHFYFFALLAMLVLYGNPLAILVAAATVALHHLLLWLWLPSSVFNYQAPWWVVAVHAAFVVLESVATVYIARSFFDNVIGLEKVVQARTREVEQKNQAMRLVLDNVDQGLLTLDATGRILPEFSTAVSRWFGQPAQGQTLPEFLRPLDTAFADNFELAWEQCAEGFLPLELSIDQAPTKLAYRRRSYHVSYRPLLDGAGALDGMLIVIADVTSDLERQRLEQERQEILQIMDRVIADRAGFTEFHHEAIELLALIENPPPNSLAAVERALHTLKGNCMIFGAQTVANVCHTIETEIAAAGGPPSPAHVAELRGAWDRLQQTLKALLGDRGHRRIEIESAQFDELLRAALDARSHDEIARMVADLKLEPTQARLGRVAAQARRLADRMNKAGIEVDVDHDMLRLDPRAWGSFWSAFIHVVRNAIDHGLEASEVREQVGKPAGGRLSLRTSVEGQDFVIAISDDGRGIDWERVREQASALGLPHASQSDLVEALFVKGLSTAGDVTEFSGRGVGLAAVRAACEGRGGRMDVESRPGQGTSIVFRFPKESMMVKPEDLLRRASTAPPARVA